MDKNARKDPVAVVCGETLVVAWGKKLRSQREKAGLSQSALSREATVSRRAIVYLEAGQREPTQGTIALLRRSLPDLPGL